MFSLFQHYIYYDTFEYIQYLATDSMTEQYYELCCESRALKTLPTHGGIGSVSSPTGSDDDVCGDRFRLGITNLAGKLPVTPSAMNIKEFRTAIPTTSIIPRKMLSKRPGSTTPTRRVGCSWRLVDQSDLKPGESLATSAWPIFSFNRLCAPTQVPTPTKRKSVTTCGRNGKWLKRVMRAAVDAMILALTLFDSVCLYTRWNRRRNE